MGLTTVNGIPAHVLLVHFVAVLVPLAAIVLLFAVLWPAARRRLGIITPLIALIALALVPITTDAGEWLERQVAPDPLVRVHTQLGDQLLYWSIGVFIVAAIWWLLHDARTGSLDPSPCAARDHRQGGDGSPRGGRGDLVDRIDGAGLSHRR